MKHHNIHSRKIILIAITGLLFSINVSADKARTLFVMLNVDYTLVKRLKKSDTAHTASLKNQEFQTQELSFNVSQETSPSFIALYKKILENKPIVGKSSYYLKRVRVTPIYKGHYRITEYVAVRPTMVYLLEKLKELNIPVRILLTSRNDDARTKNLHDHLRLRIAGQPFSNVTTFIPRDWFRLIVKTKEGKEISVKSAPELRKHYKDIRSQDIVVLLDHLQSYRFIKSKGGRDFNIVVSKFIANDSYDILQDKKEVENILKQINDFLNQEKKM